MLTFSDTEEKAVEKAIAALADMADGVGGPFALVARIIAAGRAAAPVFQRPRRGNLLLRQDACDLGRAGPGKVAERAVFQTGERNINSVFQYPALV